jgi:hypothetical protein
MPSFGESVNVKLIAAPPVGFADAASVGVSMSGTVYVVDVGTNELIVGERRTRIPGFEMEGRKA